MKKVKLVQAIFTQEEIATINTKNIKLEEENETLKDKIEFLTNCLDDRDKSIEIMKEENKKLKTELELKNLALKQVQEGSILI